MINILYTGGDITVEIAGMHFHGDSDYFLNDNPLPDTKATPAEKVNLGLKTLVRQWIEELEQIGEAPLYLPFQFEDEGSRWMRCQALENLLEICVGWSHVAGYSVSPYFIKDHVTSLSDFEPEAESILVY